MPDRISARLAAWAYRLDRWQRNGGEAELMRVVEWSVGVTLAGLLFMLAALRLSAWWMG